MEEKFHRFDEAAINLGLLDMKTDITYHPLREALEQLDELWGMDDEGFVGETTDLEGPSLEDYLEEEVSQEDDNLITVLGVDLETHFPDEQSFNLEPERIPKDEWDIAFSSQFTKTLRNIDRKLKGKILDAITEISQNPLLSKGNTVKPLTENWKDCWRYRIGDFRLVYRPDNKKNRVLLIAFAARGEVYR